jgi:hypothetical protein
MLSSIQNCFVKICTEEWEFNIQIYVWTQTSHHKLETYILTVYEWG